MLPRNLYTKAGRDARLLVNGFSQPQPTPIATSSATARYPIR